MRIILMGKDQAAPALRFLVARGHEIVGVVAPRAPSALQDEARRCEVPIVDEREIYRQVAGGWQGERFSLDDLDLVISFLYWKRIKQSLIDKPRIGVINFHPAPLPEYRGVGGCNLAIMHEHEEWEGTAHWVDSENFDTGPVVDARRFWIDPKTETASQLHRKTISALYDLFQSVIMALERGENLPSERQRGGHYFTRDDVETFRAIQPDDTPEIIDRRIRAFWFPPWPGATVEVNGQTLTVVNDEILRGLAR
jgi:methionyl-tRNA formyltransferase